jgi:hypothetical protein
METVYRQVTGRECPSPGVPLRVQIGQQVGDSRIQLAPCPDSLPGRSADDLLRFLTDCREVAHGGDVSEGGCVSIRSRPKARYSHQNPPLISSLRFLRELGTGFMTSSSHREPRRLMEVQLRDHMLPQMVFAEGSSDIISVCWSPDGRRFGLGCRSSLPAS